MTTPKDKIVAMFTSVRSCPTLAKQWGEKNATITVTAKVEQLGRNAHPHFSVTAEVYKGRNWLMGGCCHEEILKYFPKLAPLVALHLSDSPSGEPMHGEANGFYWLAGVLGGLGERYHAGSGSSAKTPEECLRILAEHVRITEDEAKGICSDVLAAFKRGAATVATSEVVSERAKQEQAKVGRDHAKAAWGAIYKAMLPRFKAEAEAGLALIAQLNGGAAK